MRSTPLLICVLTFLLPLQAQSPLPNYALGKIPSQTVWHGTTRAFQIMGGPWTMTLDGARKGPIELQPNEHLNWVFKYTPDSSDLRPFEVTISGNGQSHRFRITPQPQLPPERSIFPTDNHTQPIVSTHEVAVTKSLTPLPEVLNYHTNQLHEVRVVGQTVEWQEGHENGLYEAFGDRRDLKSMKIFAETLVIRSPLRWKQTAVAIHARNLVFEDQGKLQTTPEEVTVQAESLTAGRDGLPAGNIILHIASFTNHTTNQFIFDLSGGRGQQGGIGKKGEDGSSVQALSPSNTVIVADVGPPPLYLPLSARYDAAPNAEITYWYHDVWGPADRWKGATNRPGHGTNALPSGKPGEGGAGGSLISSIPLASTFTAAGGTSGAPAEEFETYAGGKGGTPRRSIHVLFTSYLTYIDVKAIGYNTIDGSDADVTKALTVAGPDGSYSQGTSSFSWLHPLWLRKVLNHVQTDYLANNLQPVQVNLEDYSAILSQFKASPEWSFLPLATQLEFSQLHHEIEVLLQRLYSGLDYFGNPAGWTPMLSFEVTKNIFESEIDRAIETLYLNHWIGNKAQLESEKLASLTAARDQLNKDLEQARQDYDVAIENLPLLTDRASELQTRIRTLQNALTFEEQKLLNDAREPDVVIQLRLGLKIAATICQLVPVGQPTLYAIGQGVRVASDFDPDKPWNSITNAPTIQTAYINSPFASAAAAQKEQKDKINPNQTQTNSVNYLTMLQESSVGLQAGITDISNFYQEHTGPTPEMLAQLEELKSKSPTYKALVEEVQALMEENQKFAEDIVITMQRISRLSDVMRHNLLAIESLNNAIAPAVIVVDERVTVYLESMKRRALDRLLKYHYYMAKAYEYRMLKPYTHPLNLEGLFQKIEELANLHSHTLPPDQYMTLRQIYQSTVADVAETIYEDYVSNEPTKTAPVLFDLTAEEIALLNAGQTITINPYNRGIFLVGHENVRITNIGVSSMTTEVEGGGPYGSTAYVELNIQHSGISNLKQDGKILQFRHYNENTQNPFTWSGQYNPVDNRITQIEPSAAANSLLRSLLSPQASGDMLLYSRPAAWADLFVSRAYVNTGGIHAGKKILIKSARLELRYDFIPRKALLNLKTLETLVAGVDPSVPPALDPTGQLIALATSPSVVETGLLPLITVDRPDTNGRQHARGNFIRIYSGSAGLVTLSAPETYGEWRFHQWTDQFGNPWSGPAFNTPSIQLNMNQDATIIAQYILPTAVLPTIELSFLSDNTTQLRWTGGSGIVLQTTTTLNGTWQDVPGSEGTSELSLPITIGNRFFRVIRK